MALKTPSLASPRQKWGDNAFRWTTLACSLAMPLLMAGILLGLIRNSSLSLSRFGLGFLTANVWDPVAGNFGALSSIYGTAVSTCLALLIAVPLGLVIALFLAELTTPKISAVFGTAIELLAAIPSIIYGMWGLFVLAPFMAHYVQPILGNYLGFLPFFQGPPLGIGMLTAGFILALMILPFLSSVTRDVFRMVPPLVKEAAYGTGATTWEVTKGVTLRYSLRGIVGAGFLGVGRALGETMAVTFVIGNSHSISASLFASGNSIPAALANEFTEASDPIYLSSLVELGLVLFFITMLFQAAAQLWLWSLRKRLV